MVAVRPVDLPPELAASRFARYGTIHAFACERAGRTAGRIAAIVNPRLRDETGSPLGQVGWFECANDPEAAGALFQAAFEALAGLGARLAVGPMNGGAHLPHRLLVRGFEREPFLLEPRNPPYYPRLFEEAGGFRPFRRWSNHDVDRAGIEECVRRLRASAARGGAAAAAFRVEPGDPAGGVATLARIHALLDRCWAGHTGYAPFDIDEMVEVFSGVLALLSPRTLAFAVDAATGRDAGFAFVIPDRKPRRAVGHTVAMVPEARRTGAAHQLIAHLLQNVLDDGFEEMVIALVDEDFRFFRFLPVTREHALYARPIGRTVPA